MWCCWTTASVLQTYVSHRRAAAKVSVRSGLLRGAWRHDAGDLRPQPDDALPALQDVQSVYVDAGAAIQGCCCSRGRPSAIGSSAQDLADLAPARLWRRPVAQSTNRRSLEQQCASQRVFRGRLQQRTEHTGAVAVGLTQSAAIMTYRRGRQSGCLGADSPAQPALILKTAQVLGRGTSWPPPVSGALVVGCWTVLTLPRLARWTLAQ
jgi:hypothetical protein